MRRAASVDANQSAIVAVFRAMGASVQLLHRVGQGCPDIAVGIMGFNWIVEIKDGSKKPSARRLTKDEQDWHDAWNGQVCIIESEEHAAQFVTDRRLFAIQVRQSGID